ncbi:MAG: hypothetical protein ABSG68_13910 [Thermoguttaceae bacterium]
MPLFANTKELGVRSFILKVVNNNCSEVRRLMEGPRVERRVTLVLPVWVVPCKKREALVDAAFTAVTKEFASTGVAVVLDRARGLDEVLLGFPWEGEIKWVRATAKHLSPLGGGFYQVGFRLTAIARPTDHPEIKSLTL